MKKQKTIQKFVPIVIIGLQIISCIWYLWPRESHAHLPSGFIEMLIFGGIVLLLLLITAILYVIYKPKSVIWKVLFVVSIVMLLLAWFYDKYGA